MITETRTYTIPLRDAYQEKPPYQKAPRAIKAVKSFLSKHMKAEEDSVKVSNTLNQVIWANGARNPPSKVTVVAEPADSHVHVMTEDEYAEGPDGADPVEEDAPSGGDEEQDADDQDDEANEDEADDTEES